MTSHRVLEQLCPERAHALGAPSAVPPPHGSRGSCTSVTHGGARPGRSPRVSPNSRAIVSPPDAPTPHTEPHS